MSSRISGFYRLAPAARLAALQEHASLSDEDLATYSGEGLGLDAANLMVENVISTFQLPNAVAVNFVINGADRLVPMVVEEPSVLAAVSYMAKLVRNHGGFEARADSSVMIGQIQLIQVADPDACVAKLEAALDDLIEASHEVHPRLIERGGGVRGMEVRPLTYAEEGRPTEHMVVLHVHLDCVDAMGANMINTLVEFLAPRVAELTGETVGLKILSNLADQRMATARCRIPVAALSTPTMDGEVVAARITSAWRFAWADPYRAATHNKGVMNGIDAVALATGNDWRAIEAGAHAYCAQSGQYRPMTRWEVDGDMLVGSIEVPLQFGTVGGPIRVHPTVQANLRLLECEGSKDLARVAASVGLAQNLAALRALATEGIQAGHMRMHARTVAATAGAETHEVSAVTKALCDERNYSVERARQLLDAMRAAE